ncbi:MAG: formimidoylglutamase [Pseudomonadota bacterium]
MAVSHRPKQPWTGRNDPEDGEDALRLHHLEGANASRGLVGFACDAGVARNKGRLGAREAPVAIRSAMANLSAPDGAEPFADFGDVIVSDDDLEAGQSALANAIGGNLSKLERIVVLGGGHETAWGCYLGLRQCWPKERIGIINLDAHLDLRKVGDRGPSSGTPFFQIYQSAPEQFDYICLGVAEESNTEALFRRANDLGVGLVTDRALNNNMSRARHLISELFDRNDLIYLTIDIDVLPHFTAPGVSAPAARGVPLEVIEDLIDWAFECAAKSGTDIPLADIVEVCPRLDQDGVTSRVAAFLARKLLFG